MSNLAGVLGDVYGQYQADKQVRGTEDEKQRVKDYFERQLWDTSKLDPSKLGSTEFDKISLDPRTRDAQMKALSQLQAASDAKGFDATSRQANAEAQREAAGYEQAQSQALQQNLQARGLGASGADVAGLMSAQQGGANRASAGAMQAASGAQARSMDASKASGALGSAVRGQDYGQASDKAHADDMARNNQYAAELQKLGAMGGARKDMANWWASDRAERIGNAYAQGKSVGEGGGAIGDTVMEGMGDVTSMYGGKGGGGGGGSSAMGGAPGQGFSTQSGIPWSNGAEGTKTSNELTPDERDKRGMSYLNMFGQWGQ